MWQVRLTHISSLQCIARKRWLLQASVSSTPRCRFGKEHCNSPVPEHSRRFLFLAHPATPVWCLSTRVGALLTAESAALEAIAGRSWTLAFNPAATDTADAGAQPLIGVPASCPDDAGDGLAKRYYFVKLTEVLDLRVDIPLHQLAIKGPQVIDLFLRVAICWRAWQGTHAISRHILNALCARPARCDEAACPEQCGGWILSMLGRCPTAGPAKSAFHVICMASDAATVSGRGTNRTQPSNFAWRRS